MLIKRNVLTMTEGNSLLNEINKLDLPLYEKNIHTKLDDNFEWTDTICRLNYPDLGPLIVRYIISTNTKDENKNIIGYHTDSDKNNEITAILYLKGDSTKGGELQIEGKKKHRFEKNALFIMPSHLRHRANPYYGDETRLAIKWRFVRR